MRLRSGMVILRVCLGQGEGGRYETGAGRLDLDVWVSGKGANWDELPGPRQI